MKKSLLIGLILCITVSTVWFWWSNTSYKPEFRRFENLIIVSESADKALLNFDLVLFNGANVEAILINTEISASSNDVRFAKLSQTNLSVLKPMSEFVLPLKCQVDISNLSASQGFSSIIEKALNENRSIKVKFEGYCQIKFRNESFRIPVSHEENIQFN